MTLREKIEQIEKQTLSPYAMLSMDSEGRARKEDLCDVRTEFQRDRDRVIHSKAFRRLKHKTQVFLAPEGDHYRTRLTHTLEVSQIARTVAKALFLNEDLTEAISLGHDLGHTPFGHTGENALNALCPQGFCHNEQSLRVVNILERKGGLNLTHEVRDGILCHTGPKKPQTLEGKIVRLADRIAYINHDLDDSIRAGILKDEEVPDEIRLGCGTKNSQRINSIITDLILNSADGNIKMSPDMQKTFDFFHKFMYSDVYLNPRAKREESKVEGILSKLYDYYTGHPEKLPEDYKYIIDSEGVGRAACDYISGMTDGYAMEKFGELFIPFAWTVK